MTAQALAKMNIDDAVQNMIDPSGRSLEVVRVANSALFALRWKEGGSLPDTDPHKLHQAKWTKAEFATEAARDYLRARWQMSEDSKTSRPKREAASGE